MSKRYVTLYDEGCGRKQRVTHRWVKDNTISDFDTIEEAREHILAFEQHFDLALASEVIQVILTMEPNEVFCVEGTEYSIVDLAPWVEITKRIDDVTSVLDGLKAEMKSRDINLYQLPEFLQADLVDQMYYWLPSSVSC